MRDLLEASGYVIFISKAIQEKYTRLYKLKKYTMFLTALYWMIILYPIM